MCDFDSVGRVKSPYVADVGERIEGQPIRREALLNRLGGVEQRIDPDLPSRIDFANLDREIKQKYKSEVDRKFALGALHVREYARRLSSIQDHIIRGAVRTKEDFEKIKEAIEAVESQIVDDNYLGDEESVDRIAAQSYLDEVKQIFNSFCRYSERLDEVYSDLAKEDVNLEQKLQDIEQMERGINEDEFLKKESGAYQRPLNAKLDKVWERTRAVSSYKTYLGNIEGFKKQIYENVGDPKKVDKGTLEFLEGLDKGISDLGKKIEEEKLFSHENKFYKDRLREPLENLRETHDRKRSLVQSFLGYVEKIEDFKRQLDRSDTNLLDVSRQILNLEKEVEKASIFKDGDEIFRNELNRRLSDLRDLLEELKMKDIERLISENVPSLKDALRKDLISKECKDAFRKLYDHGYLQSKIFLKRVERLISSGHGPFKRSDMGEKDYAKIANEFIPSLASGEIEYIDFLLMGPHLDSFALMMKLDLNSEYDPETIRLRHELTIAKREFAKALQRKKGFFKKEGFESTFHDIVFDEGFINDILQDKSLRYKNIDLVLVKILLLEAKLSRKLSDKSQMEKFCNYLKDLGIEGDLEEIKDYVNMGFRSTKEKEAAIKSIKNFVKKLESDENASEVFFKALTKFDQKVGAEITLDTIIRNFTDTYTEGELELENLIIDVSKKGIYRNDLKAQKEIEDVLRKIEESDRRLSSLTEKLKESKDRLLQIKEKIDSSFSVLEDVVGLNRDRPSGRSSAIGVLNFYEKFRTLEKKGVNSLEEEDFKEILDVLKGLENFKIEYMHSKKEIRTSDTYREFRKKIEEIRDVLEGKRKFFKRKRQAPLERKDVEDIWNHILEIKGLFDRNNVEEKAKAILLLRTGKDDPKEIKGDEKGLLEQRKELEDEIGKLEKEIRTIGEKVSDLIEDFKRKGKKYLKSEFKLADQLVYAAILDDFIRSGKMIDEYQPNREYIKDAISRFGFSVLELAGGDSLLLGASKSFNQFLNEFREKDFLKKLSGEIKLKKEIEKKVREIKKDLPSEVLELSELSKIEKFFETLGPDQKLTLNFGKTVSLEGEDLPAGPVDMGLQFEFTEENSLSVLNKDGVYIFILKGGKGAGGRVDVGSFLNILRASAKVEGKAIKGCEISFSKKESARDFLLGLVTGNRLESRLFAGQKIRFLDEKGISVGAEVSLGKELEAPLPDVPFLVGSLEAEAKICANAEMEAKWQEIRDFDYVRRSKSITYRASLEAIVGGLDHEIGGSKDYEVTKTTELVFYHNFISPETNVRRRFSSGKDLLKRVKALGINLDENDSRLKIVNVFSDDLSSVEFVWRLDEEAAFQIAESQLFGSDSGGEHVKEKLGPDNFILDSINLTIKEGGYRVEDSKGFRALQLFHHAEIVGEREITIPLS